MSTQYSAFFDNPHHGILRQLIAALHSCTMLAQVYALKRLVRGLGSSHDAARQGFGLALSAALVKVPEIESLPALDMLDAALEVSKSTKVSSPLREAAVVYQHTQVLASTVCLALA